MQKDYRQCLDKLAGRPLRGKPRLFVLLLPGIEAAVNSGQSLKKIWEALATEGLQMSYHSFHKAVWRARRTRKPTATSNWGKQDKPSEAQGLREAKVETVGERDPLANLSDWKKTGLVFIGGVHGVLKRSDRQRRTRMTKTNGNGSGGTSIHIALQGKAGLGKSLISAILSQYLLSKGQDVRGITRPSESDAFEIPGFGGQLPEPLKRWKRRPTRIYCSWNG